MQTQPKQKMRKRNGGMSVSVKIENGLEWRMAVE
jgi:hypothetical protein